MHALILTSSLAPAGLTILADRFDILPVAVAAWLAWFYAIALWLKVV